jgi:transposase
VGDGPAPRIDDRTFIDAVLYRAQTGLPWRDRPEPCGSWKTVFNRFSNSHRGQWATTFKALRIKTDEESVMIDASVVLAHQDASGGKGEATRSSTCKVGHSA